MIREYLKELRELEKMKGDRIYLVDIVSQTAQQSRYGLDSGYSFERRQITGYVIPSNSAEGLSLAGNNQRSSGSYDAYLNLTTGFDPQQIRDTTYLQVVSLGLFEMLLKQIFREYDRPIYAIYELRETTDSKKHFRDLKLDFSGVV